MLCMDLAHRDVRVQLSFVTTTTTAAARAPHQRQPARSKRAPGHVLAKVRGAPPAAQGLRARRAAQPVRHQERTPCVERDHNGDRRRRGRRRQLALEERDGSSPRTRSCDGISSAQLLTKAASAPVVRRSDGGLAVRVSQMTTTEAARTSHHDDECSNMASLFIRSIIMWGRGVHI